jgi:hypothetical protein
MTRNEKVRSIMGFLWIVFGDSDIWATHIINFEPDHLIEAFERYITSDDYTAKWIIHPIMTQCIYYQYCEKHGLLTYDEIHHNLLDEKK